MIFQGKQRTLEKGSIMLEVIAVLALMGVMGAMLFRQIYQRNQELHNVQMASEMRTVKEAFSACLQSNVQTVIGACSSTIVDLSGGEEALCTGYNSSTAAGCIKEYLPSGWFPDDEEEDLGTTLSKYYYFYTYVYKQADSSQKVKIYGLIVPKEETLPATGWNFKRAARVALLIGADGGVYDEDVFGDDIQGSLGTWSLEVDDITIPERDSAEIPTYVAITGMDVFTPEYDVPEGKVNFAQDLDLQVNKLNVYSSFSIGNSSTSCILDGDIKHNQSIFENDVFSVINDTVRTYSDCFPTFWVEADSDGKVYTRNDLNVGMERADGTPAIRLSKEGVIIFKDTVEDPQENDADKKTKSYMLDPAYTSIMNDVKLMSRGGARLSDILPNYILKNVEDDDLSANVNTQITMPTCPTGYKKALVVIPHLDVKTQKISVTNSIPTTSINLDEVLNREGEKIVVTNVTDGSPSKNAISASTTAPTATVLLSDDNSGSQVATGVPTIQVWSGANCNSEDGSNYSKTSSGANFCIKADKTVRVTYQTYCVYEKPANVLSAYTSEVNCKKAGYIWKDGSCIGDTSIDANRPKDKRFTAKTQAECQALGGTWVSGTPGTCSW